MIINLDEPWTECTICGADTPSKWGVPVWSGMIVANDWPGDWGGVPACKSCYEQHTRGMHVEVLTDEYDQISEDYKR